MNVTTIPTHQHWQKPFFIALAVWLAMAVATSAYFYDGRGALVSFLSCAFLVAGFKLTELLVGVMTGVAKANKTGIAMVFLAKLLWWGLVFYSMRGGLEGREIPLAIGVGAFLLSILTAGLALTGLPKVSFKDPS